jgi:proline iminopeptidase
MKPSSRRLLALVALSLVFACARSGSGTAAVELTSGPRKFTSHGVELAAHVAGSGPVLFAHPGGPGSEWSYLRMKEVEKAFTVVYIEPVGTGSSGKLARVADYTIPRYVEDIEALRAHLGLERFYLLGHSHGGFVAQAYALAHGDRLAGLILYDTTPTTGAEWQKDLERNLEWFEREPWFADAAAALAQETSATTDEELTAILRREAPLYFADYSGRKGELDPLIATMRISVAPTKGTAEPGAPREVGVAPVFEVRDRLAEIRVPTLVLVGRRDFVCSLEMAKILDTGIPESRLVVLERSGHMGHIEEPELFARAVTGFLKAVQGRE